jgi:hypothetical protein
MSELPPSHPPSSNVLTYVVVILVVFGAVGFLFLLFGNLFLVALAPFGLLGILAALHYLLWGRALSDGAEKDGDAPPN